MTTPSEAPHSNGVSRRVLVTGATGFIGGRFIRDLAGSDDVIATCRGLRSDWGSYVTPVTWEAAKGAPEVLLALFEPEVVVHLMAFSRTEACAQHPEKAYLLNTEVTERLAQAACYRGVRMIFTSTDLVFDGRKGNYVEDDAPNAMTTYARTKIEAEKSLINVFSQRPELLTLFRVGLCYGWGDESHRGPAGWVLDDLGTGRPVDLFEDEFRAPLYVGDASRALVESINNDHCGVYHLAGPERMDRATLGRKMAENFGLDANLIRPKSVREYPGPEPRSPDCSLNIAKFTQTFGWKPAGVDEGLAHMAGENRV